MSSRERQLRQRMQEKEEQREHERTMREKQAAMQEAFGGADGISKTAIEGMLSAEDISVGGPDDLQEKTVAKIQSLLSRDWVLANLTEAQEHDARHKLEVMKLKVLGMHPPPDSGIQGQYRAFLLDDEDENLDALTQQERILIDELFETLKTRFTRGRGGFERELIETNIARTETGEDEPEDDSGGLTGLFS
jgi:hypothetical protein